MHAIHTILYYVVHTLHIIHISYNTNISRSKDNQAMKFGQLI